MKSILAPCQELISTGMLIIVQSLVQKVSELSFKETQRKETTLQGNHFGGRPVVNSLNNVSLTNYAFLLVWDRGERGGGGIQNVPALSFDVNNLFIYSLRVD